MITSGGELLAIDKVLTDGITLSGDGVKKPIGIHSDYKVDVSSYNVIPGTSNVSVGVDTNPDDKLITFRISAAPGGGGGGAIVYRKDNYVYIDNVQSAVGLDQDFITSASQGYSAWQAILTSADDWNKGKTYYEGPNISIDESNNISGRDWSPELANKLDVFVYTTWSAAVEQSAADLSAAIENIDITKYDDVSATVYNNSAHWNESYAYVSNFSGDFNTWSAKVEQSAADMSAYIKTNEPNWTNSAVYVESLTPGLLSVESAFDTNEKTITYTLSAKQNEETVYTAGDWIDSDKLANNAEIAVSGFKSLKTQYPLCFSADDTDPNVVWLIHEEEAKKDSKVCVICNGWNGGTNYTSDASRLYVTVPEANINGEYTFHFGAEMGVQININANFIAKDGTEDMIGEVGFGGASASIGGTLIPVTNAINFNMFGACKTQYYAASTIARVDANEFGGSFPAEGIDVKFKFIGDADFLQTIENPCITIHEIIGEA